MPRPVPTSGLVCGSGGTNKRVDRFRIASSPRISHCIAGQQLRHAYYVFMVNGNGRSGASLSDTSHAHGLGPARSVDVLGTEPLISAYQEMVVIWAGHGPRQPHPCCSGAPLSRSPHLRYIRGC
jgi:hypothetical protein